MPRFVRPAWIEVRADGPERGAGPRSRDGYLSARLTLRTADATVSPAITFDAGGTDDSGRARLSLTIPAGFDIEIDGVPMLTGEPSRSLRIVARPEVE